jgi:hypothetical protein
MLRMGEPQGSLWGGQGVLVGGAFEIFEVLLGPEAAFCLPFRRKQLETWRWWPFCRGLASRPRAL